jgi:hypothetical protein
VLVDLAVERGGNVEGAKAGEVADIDGIKIVGFANLAGRVPASASSLLARNLVSFIETLVDKSTKGGDGELGRRSRQGDRAGQRRCGHSSEVSVEKRIRSAAMEHIVQAVDRFVFRLTIVVFAVFVGYIMVWSVTPALHTPLMSVTNAISSVIVVARCSRSAWPSWATVKRRCGRGLRFHRVEFRFSQYVRRLLGHATHARDVQEEAEVSRGRHDRQSFRIALSDRRCILALRGLSSPASSRHGNFLGMGYAGIDNLLFYRDNRMMQLGDAKKVVESIVKAI